MVTKKKARGMTTLGAFYLLIVLMLLKSMSDETAEGNVYTLLNQEPLTIAAVLLPLVLFFGYSFRAMGAQGWKSFMKNHFMKYFVMFYSLVVTAYLIDFLLFTGSPESATDYGFAALLFLSLFIVFLLLKHLEKAKYALIDKSAFARFKPAAFMFGSIFVIGLPLAVIYKIIWALPWRPTLSIGLFQGMFATTGLMMPSSKRKGKLFFLVFFAAMLVLVIYLVGLQFRLPSGALNWMSVAGAILIIIAYVSHRWIPERSTIMKFLDELAKDK